MNTIGIGYITYPTDVSYEEYIQTSYKTSTVSFIADQSSVYHKIPVNRGILNEIYFPVPSKKELTGSCVVYVRPSNKVDPVILGVIEVVRVKSNLLPGQWRYTSVFNSNNISFIQGDVLRGEIDLVVHSEDTDSEIVVRATSKSKNSKILVETDGVFEVSTEKEIKTYSDDSTTIESKKDTKLDGESITLGSDNLEKAALGETLSTLIEDLIDTLVSGVVAVSGATGSFNPATVLKLQTIKAKVDTILASKVKIE